MRTFAKALALVATIALFVTNASAQSLNFVNFESGHVRPLALSPDGDRLFAVNTPDNRLAIFDIVAGDLTPAGEVPVGMEPVAAAARINTGGSTEVWVVNHLSDSVSIVEIDDANPGLSRVVRTLMVGDEPRDIVFGGPSGEHAFITTARRGQNVPGSVPPLLSTPGVDRALVWVFDTDATGDPLGGTPTTILELFGDTPRALAVSADGSKVYAAVFHSGNQTTIVPEPIVTNNGGLPPPPPIAPADPPLVGLIVKYDPMSDEWHDELGRDWGGFVEFDLPDHDVFVIDATANPPVATSSVPSVGTVLFNMAVRPDNGKLYVSNTDARNEVRFEHFLQGNQGVQGHIAESHLAIVDNGASTSVHINPHIDYSVPTGPESEIADSLAFPTDLTFSSDGSLLFTAAFGSAKVGVFDSNSLEASDGTPSDRIDVGEGPSGVVLDEPRDQLYVFNRLDQTISVVTDAATAQRTVAATVPVGFDPSPKLVRNGRRFLYDAALTSGHGDSACASCHIFGDLDSLGWDLGDPNGTVEPNPNPFVNNGVPSVPFHPLKGPMTTQSLRGMAGQGPMHWRGDRTGAPEGDALDEDAAFKRFNGAFPGLLGRAEQLTDAEMQAFTDFILTVVYPPNPIRALDDVASASEALGEQLFTLVPFDGVNCDVCHGLPTGANGLSTQEGAVTQDMKVPHLRNQYQKVGMFGMQGIFNIPPTGFQGDQIRGFGFLHDGSIASLFNFLQAFDFENFQLGDPERQAVVDFQFALDTGLKPIVGQQLTVGPDSFLVPNLPLASVLARRDLLIARDEAGDCDLVVKITALGESRGGLYDGGDNFITDRIAEGTIDKDALLNLADAAGFEQTYTCVPPGTGIRAGIDRDEDGWRDHDEVDLGTDPAAPWHLVPYCNGGALEGIGKPKVKVSRLDKPAGEQKLSLRAEWVLDPTAPPLDPIEFGFNLHLVTTQGETILMRSIPPGARASNQESGWKVNNAGTRWDYKDKTGSAAGGITRVKITDKSKKLPGLVQIRVKGKDGDFIVDSDEIPLQMIVVPGGGQQANTGQCATRTFNPPEGDKPRCDFSGSGKSLRCS